MASEAGGSLIKQYFRFAELVDDLFRSALSCPFIPHFYEIMLGIVFGEQIIEEALSASRD
jgi:hypothetical protein